jgi:hypothetical protein
MPFRVTARREESLRGIKSKRAILGKERISEPQLRSFLCGTRDSSVAAERLLRNDTLPLAFCLLGIYKLPRSRNLLQIGGNEFVKGSTLGVPPL